MAKFRNGNLVLTSSQTIIQGSTTVLTTDRSASFSNLSIDASGNIQIGSGTQISEFSTDGTLAGDSDSALPTEKAVKDYVDTSISGLSPNKISQLDSKVEVTDSGSNGLIQFVADNAEVMRASSTGVSIGSQTQNFKFEVHASNPTRGIVGLISNDSSSAQTGSQLEFHQQGIAYWTIGQPAAVDAFSIYSGRYIGGDGNEIFRVDSSGVRIYGSTAADGHLYAGTTDPTNTTRLNYDGYFYATRVYNAVWNDIADFQLLADELVPGKCYFDSVNGAKICDIRCQKGVIGIASDTYGYGVGQSSDVPQVPIAVCGWVLAYVNGECETGDALTNDANGNLVKMTDQEKCAYPERIVATYKKPEYADSFGTISNKIKVNGRHWVKVK